MQSNQLFVPIRDQNIYETASEIGLAFVHEGGSNILLLKMNKYECQLVNNKQLKTKQQQKIPQTNLTVISLSPAGRKSIQTLPFCHTV